MSENSPWKLPEIRGPVVAGRARAQSASALDTEARELRQRGYDQGYQAGTAAAQAEALALRAELGARTHALEALLAAMAAPLERVDEAAANDLARLAISIGAQLARRELARDPSQLIPIVRDCIGLLPQGSRQVRVQMHPRDAQVVRELLAEPTGERAWTLAEDPVLARGGCIVTTEHSRIDATFDGRVAAVVAALLGDERDGAREGAAAGEGGDAVPGLP
jgi:flagellar assembly protein FliH